MSPLIMKKLLYLFFTTLILASCSENIEDNRPALQGVINNELYRAIDAQAIRGLDGDLTITGLTTGDDLTLRLSSAAAGTYILGGDSPNYAKFTTPSGFTYNTNPDGKGEVVITRLDQVNQKVYGSFEFDAIISGLDTIYVRNGVFFEVPYIQQTEADINDDPEITCNAGNFVALIDNDHTLSQGLNICIKAVANEDQIVITATDPDEKIIVRVPVTTGVGQNPLPAEGFSASYTNLETMVTEEANTGNFIVLSHNINARLIKITFNFITDNHIIDSASLNVTYQ